MSREWDRPKKDKNAFKAMQVFMNLDEYPDIKAKFEDRFFGKIRCEPHIYELWKWFSQKQVQQFLNYAKTFFDKFGTLEKNLLFGDGSKTGLKPWGETKKWPFPKIAKFDEVGKQQFEDYLNRCLAHIQHKYDLKQRGGCSEDGSDNDGNRNVRSSPRKRRIGDVEQNAVNKRRRLMGGAHNYKAIKDNNRGNSNNKQNTPSPSPSKSKSKSKTKKKKKVTVPKRNKPAQKARDGSLSPAPEPSPEPSPAPKPSPEPTPPCPAIPQGILDEEEENGPRVQKPLPKVTEIIRIYGSGDERREFRSSPDKYKAENSQYNKKKHESYSIFNRKKLKELNRKQRKWNNELMQQNENKNKNSNKNKNKNKKKKNKNKNKNKSKNKEKISVCYLFHEASIFFLDHPTFHLIHQFIFSCAFYHSG